jgi:hypothetical protein
MSSILAYYKLAYRHMENHEFYGPSGVDSVGGRVASGIAEVAVETARDFVEAVIPDELKPSYRAEQNPMPTIIFIKEDTQRLTTVRAKLAEMTGAPADHPEQPVNQSDNSVVT